MKVQLGNIIKFNSFLKSIEDKQLDISLAYKIFSIYSAIENDIKFYYDKLSKILDKYAQRNEDGSVKMSDDNSQVLIIQDKISDCEKEMENLFTYEVEIDCPKIKISELSVIDGLNISISEIAQISAFLEK